MITITSLDEMTLPHGRVIEWNREILRAEKIVSNLITGTTIGYVFYEMKLFTTVSITHLPYRRFAVGRRESASEKAQNMPERMLPI